MDDSSGLRELFEEVAALIRGSPVSPDLESSDTDKLRMYGLYKRVTAGNCNEAEAPSRFKVVAHAKYQAWADCQDLTTEEAMLAYVEMSASQQHSLGQKCREKLERWKQSSKSKWTTSSPAVDREEECIPSSGEEETVVATRPIFSDESNKMEGTTDPTKHWLGKRFGVRPLIPRGQLDISYRDLAFAAYQCLWPSSMKRYCQLETQISQFWGTGEKEYVLAGLSVRSLLDLYLRSACYPDESEIVVTPAINIPGMMHVLRHHNIKVKPVDMQGPVVGVNVDAVKKAITKKTVAIMVIHPFGMISTNTEKMNELRLVATEHKLHILEDCAECFTGLASNCYKGSTDAHASFFSFGTIKTATALGGGIVILRNDDVYDKMYRMHHFLYPEQTCTQYLCKVLCCVVVRFIADYPLLYGILFAVVSWAGLDFDVIVSTCIRSFVPKDSIRRKSNGPRQNDLESRMPYTNVIKQLRTRPSSALLSVILRRLEQCRQKAPSVQARVEQCRYMASMLEKLAPNVIRPEALSESAENFWLFPIQVTSPDTVSRHLCKEGFDVPRGLSQLECVAKYSSLPTSCPRAEELMDGVLYLPVSSRSMTKGDLRQMAAALNVATTPVSGTVAVIDVVCDSCKSRRNARKGIQRPKGLSAAVVSLVFVDGWFFRCIPLSGPICRAAWAGLGFYTAFVAVAIFGAVALRWSMADFYVNSSQCFSKYSSMLFRQPQSDEETSMSCERSENDKSESDKPLLNMDVLRIPKVRAPKATTADDLLQSPVVLLTGATGFIGRLLLRDLLLHRKALAIEGGVVVICRSKLGKTAHERISALLDDPMYSFLSQEEKQKLVRVVEGDVTKSNVGLSPDVIKEICDGLDVSHVIHCAATVSFTQTLEEAAVSNISSSLNLKSLTGRLKRKSAKYVHISTAFVHGGQAGTACDPLPEQLHCLDEYDAVELYRSMLGTQYVASSAMKDLRFPNTYTFSKCICEHLLARETNVPTIVIRPSIVGPAVQHPYEGWAGAKPTTIVAAACLYMSYQWNLWCFGNHRVPFIPVDVVSAFVIAKAFDDDSGASDATCDSPTPYSSDESYERVSQFSDSSNSESDNETGPSPPAPLVTRLGQSYKYRIHTLAWDTSSPDSAMFSWIDYAVAITHLGAVLGHFSRLTAYIGLLVAVRLLPGMGLNTERFKTLHRLLVQFPIDTVVSSFKLLGWYPLRIAKLSKLSAFLDLPLLFFPFMNVNFHFSSELVAPANMDGERYLFSCLVAAKHFMDTSQSRHQHKAISRTTKDVSARQESAETNPSVLVIGGISHKPPCADFWWALTQPRGNVFVRLAGWGFRKILRATSVAVTVDVELFSASMRSVSSGTNDERPHLILAPNHRSFFDFILISYICFSLPELNIEIPFIAAADDFEHLPVFGWLAAKSNAFFVRRGRGKADPCLAETLDALKKDNGDQGVCIEVFIEGSRSRDRRFLRPKTGMLRCLVNSGGEHLILPISINYEQIPEQSVLANEADHGFRSGLSNGGLLRWLQKVFFGSVDIGRIHVAVAKPIHVSEVQQDFGALAMEIQRRQQALVYVSGYHIHTASKVLTTSPATTSRALAAVGCRFWPGYENCPSCWNALELPTSTSEEWATLLHFGHTLSSFFETSRPKWCKWLNETGTASCVPTKLDSSYVVELIDALGKFFDNADDHVDKALAQLRAKGFGEPDGSHVIQFIMRELQDFPLLLIRAAVSFRLGDEQVIVNGASSLASRTKHEDFRNLISSTNEDFGDGDDDDESFGFWGFRDSGFVVQAEQSGRMSVTMKGTRYGICGKSLKKLIPFIENETKTRIDPFNESAFPPLTLGPLECNLCQEDVELLRATMTKISISASDRARHGSGHSQEDMYLIRSGSIVQIRLPDAVVWPSSEDEVGQLVSAAKSKDWCLIPFGGGTNVSHATRCPAKEVEPRPILSVDMRLMNRVLWVNEEDGLAHVEAGITGRDLVQEMLRRGYTIGHEPDSIEFSTLGGWIATKASGMKRNKYGNIEDIVKSVRVAGSEGVLWRGKHGETTSTCGRESRGIDLLSITVGSEGCFGIITSAVIRIWPLPECQDHDSVILPDFEHGLRFSRDVARLGPNLPSSVRLLDNEHFRLGRSLEGGSTVIERGLTYLWKMAHPVARSCSAESAVCATIAFEGTREEVESQRRAIRTLASRHGGTCVGSRVGKSGYELTFAIAYLRDFAMTYNFLAESFETFAPWSKVESIIRATKERIKKEHRLCALPGEPFIGSRVTQLYHEGACLYFYFCMNICGVKNPCSVFAKIEHAARQEILDRGGSLSHHHGIGKVRSEFTKKMDSDAFHSFLASLKRSVDPTNTFGARNGAIE